MSWLVGLEPQGALRLRGALDDAASSLDACASRVQRLLDEAGTNCRAPMDIRGAARTCAGTAQDLSRRLSVIRDGPAALTRAVASRSGDRRRAPSRTWSGAAWRRRRSS